MDLFANALKFVQLVQTISNAYMKEAHVVFGISTEVGIASVTVMMQSADLAQLDTKGTIVR